MKNRRKDSYKRAAAIMFGVPYSMVTEHQRNMAKKAALGDKYEVKASQIGRMTSSPHNTPQQIEKPKGLKLEDTTRMGMRTDHNGKLIEVSIMHPNPPSEPIRYPLYICFNCGKDTDTLYAGIMCLKCKESEEQNMNNQ